MMSTYEEIKMSELVSVEESDENITLTFKEGRRVSINVLGGKLVSEVSS